MITEAAQTPKQVDDSRMAFRVVTDVPGLRSLEEDWIRLESSAAGVTCGFLEFLEQAVEEAESIAPHVVTAIAGDSVRLIAPFFRTHAKKKFTVGLPKPISVPVEILWLESETFLGCLTVESVRNLIDFTMRSVPVDLLRFGALPMDSEFYAALQSAIGARRSTSPPSLRDKWVIEFPDDFEVYLKTLGSTKARYNIRRSLRRFQELQHGALRCFTHESQVAEFLSIGNALSRNTYQWKLGEGLANDDRMLRMLSRDARNGLLRSYLLYAGDTPCAFVRGTLKNGRYEFINTGFDPAFGDHSPGTVLLLEVVRDLMETTDCRVLDFGYAGWEYKVRFGTRAYATGYVEVCRPGWNYGRLLIGADRTLAASKALFRRIVRRSARDTTSRTSQPEANSSY